jgi:hypothetical protein
VSVGRSASSGALALVGLLVACREASPAAGDEIAAELRGLRLALAAGAQGVDNLAELRSQVAALAAAQQGIEARHADLQRDVAAWLHGVAGELGSERTAAATAWRERLDEFERALRQQREGQRALEDALQQGIDRAAQRLDGMLDRLAPPATPAATSTPSAARDGGSAAPGATAAPPPNLLPDRGGMPSGPGATAAPPASPLPDRGAMPAAPGRTAAPPSNPPPDRGGLSEAPVRTTAAPPAPRARDGDAVAAAAGAIGNGDAAGVRAGVAAGSPALVQALWLVLAAVGAVSASWWIRREVHAARRERTHDPLAAVEGVPPTCIASFEQLGGMARADAPSAGRPTDQAALQPSSPLAAALGSGARGAMPLPAALGEPEILVGTNAELARWQNLLASEPAVLRTPAPQVRGDGDRGELRFWWRPDVGPAARLRLRLRLRLRTAPPAA